MSRRSFSFPKKIERCAEEVSRGSIKKIAIFELADRARGIADKRGCVLLPDLC